VHGGPDHYARLTATNHFREFLTAGGRYRSTRRRTAHDADARRTLAAFGT
jgi:hypothetical protein